MKRDEEYDSLTEKCESCDEPVRVYEAFKEDGVYYHPECAGVYQCERCGEWCDTEIKRCPRCGESRG